VAYDKSIELRIEKLIASWPDAEKKKMFGGVCYLLHGNICFGGAGKPRDSIEAATITPTVINYGSAAI
jgi:hypothetical protein